MGGVVQSWQQRDSVGGELQVEDAVQSGGSLDELGRCCARPDRGGIGEDAADVGCGVGRTEQPGECGERGQVGASEGDRDERDVFVAAVGSEQLTGV